MIVGRQIWRWLTGKPILPKNKQQELLSVMPLLALDLELTSLDPDNAKITSIGWVEGRASCIDVSTCYYSVVRGAQDLAQSPVIHGLTATTIATGASVSHIIKQLCRFSQSHVWLLHNAALDMAVLHNVMMANRIRCPQIVTIDTLLLELYQLRKQQETVAPDSATLTACRRRHNLPDVPAHNALDDAMATLQLWFAQCHVLDPLGSLKLNDITHTGAVTCHHLGVDDN